MSVAFLKLSSIQALSSIHWQEFRAFELLRSGSDRAEYLLIKEAKIIAMTCTHAALKRRDLVSIGFKVLCRVVHTSTDTLVTELSELWLLDKLEHVCHKHDVTCFCFIKGIKVKINVIQLCWFLFWIHAFWFEFQFDNILMEESAQILEIETFIPLLLQVFYEFDMLVTMILSNLWALIWHFGLEWRDCWIASVKMNNITVWN